MGKMARMAIRMLIRRWYPAVILVFLLAGCGPNNRPYGVPFKSDLVAEAAGKTASFTAPHNGQIWVAGPGHPGQERYIVFGGLIKFGQTLTVDPQKREVTINGEKQKAEIVGGNSYYQVWFEPSSDD